MTHTIHETIPSGFSFADRLQVESFMRIGSVDGASKVALVAGPGELPRLAVRLRPPRFRGDNYTDAYRRGWREGKATTSDNGIESTAFWDGYRDAAEGRMKWHLAYCVNHGDHAAGCGA